MTLSTLHVDDAYTVCMSSQPTVISRMLTFQFAQNFLQLFFENCLHKTE